MSETIATPIYGGSKPLKHFQINEKDNGWELCIDCGVFHREYVFTTAARAMKSIAEFMRTPVVDSTYSIIGNPKQTGHSVSEDTETAEDQPNALDDLVDEGDKPTPLANRTIRIGGLSEGRTIIDEEE
jgi:hypothetical protein